jgi:hypothetical protein
MVYTRRGLEGSDALPDLPTTRSSKAIASSALKILGSFIVEPKAIRSLPYPFFKRRYHYWDCVFEFPEIVICTVRMSSNEVCKAQCLTDLFVKPLLALLKGFGIADLMSNGRSTDAHSKREQGIADAHGGIDLALLTVSRAQPGSSVPANPNSSQCPFAIKRYP